jgi:hypothetical protein
LKPHQILLKTTSPPKTYDIQRLIISGSAPIGGAKDIIKHWANGSSPTKTIEIPKSREAAFCEGSREAPGRLCKNLLPRNFLPPARSRFFRVRFCLAF